MTKMENKSMTSFEDVRHLARNTIVPQAQNGMTTQLSFKNGLSRIRNIFWYIFEILKFLRFWDFENFEILKILRFWKFWDLENFEILKILRFWKFWDFENFEILKILRFWNFCKSWGICSDVQEMFPIMRSYEVEILRLKMLAFLKFWDFHNFEIWTILRFWKFLDFWKF